MAETVPSAADVGEAAHAQQRRKAYGRTNGAVREATDDDGQRTFRHADEGTPDPGGTGWARQAGPRLGATEQSRGVVARLRSPRPRGHPAGTGTEPRSRAGSDPLRTHARVAVHLLPGCG